MNPFQLISSILLFTLALSSCSSKDDIDDKGKRNQDWVWWVDEETGKGEWIKYSDATTVKNGTATGFYFNGNICDISKLKDGVIIDTIRRFDINGVLDGYVIMTGDSSGNYFINNGPYSRQRKEGGLLFDGIVENHREGKRWQIFYSNNQLQLDRNIEDSIGYSIEFYENGNKKYIAKGIFHNYDLKMDKDKPRIASWYLEQGYAMTYFENGQMNDSCQVKNGYPIDQLFTWYESGNLKSIVSIENMKKNGLALTYHENGQMKDSLYFTNDIPDGFGAEWYSNGTLKAKARMKDGVLDGTFYSYYENGKPKKIGTYSYGKAIGKAQEYDSLGNLKN